MRRPDPRSPLSLIGGSEANSALRLANASDLVDANVVHDDDVTALEGRSEDVFDIRQEAYGPSTKKGAVTRASCGPSLASYLTRRLSGPLNASPSKLKARRACTANR